MVDWEPKICASCKHLKGLRAWDLNWLRTATEEFVEQGPIPYDLEVGEVKGLHKLIEATQYVLRQSFRCTREKTWIHLADEGCSLWEPREMGG
jgi:hypothetical protein